MLTTDDYRNLLALISSPRLTINGTEAIVLANLQVKLQKAMQPKPPTTEDDDIGNSPGLTE